MSENSRDLIEIMQKQSEQITAYEKALEAVYRNSPHPMAKPLIERLAEKYQGQFLINIQIIQSERDGL